jgi:hypothetical protein
MRMRNQRRNEIDKVMVEAASRVCSFYVQHIIYSDLSVIASLLGWLIRNCRLSFFVHTVVFSAE